MTRHLRATDRTTYCGERLDHVLHSTRFHLLSTCGRCYATERFYSHLGLDPVGWQAEIMHLWGTEQRGETVYVRKPRKS